MPPEMLGLTGPKATFLQMPKILTRHATPGVALIIFVQTLNGVKPRRGQIESVAGLQHDFVQLGLSELGVLFW